MPRHFAFLRAINVGGHVVTMARLRAVFEGLGFDGVETFIASGNVVFESRSAGGTALARKIERVLRDALGYEVATFLRTAPEVAAIASAEVFTKAQTSAATGVFVGLVEAPITRTQINAIKKLSSDDDILHGQGREIYWCRRLSHSDSKLSYAQFERAVGTAATFRGINTIQRLAAKYVS